MDVTFDTFPRLAMRTNNPLAGTYNNVPPDLIHAVLGVADELREYSLADSKINKLEEIGDLLWFLSLAADVVERETNIHVWDQAKGELKEFPEILSQTLDWEYRVQDLAGLVKKPYAYGPSKHIPWGYIAEAIRHGVVMCAAAAWIDGNETIESVMQRNIDKLKARFPDRFCEAAAYKRDLHAEGRALRRTGINLSDLQWSKLENFVRGAVAWRIARHTEERDKIVSELQKDGCKMDSKFLGDSVWVVAQWRNESR
jgi:NTP pyrophosphatase (non-canonical NTP hydrolase)